MKKNILAILILAVTLINLTLTAVCLFVVMPTATKTNNLITKVVQMLDMEVEGVPLAPTEEHVALDDLQHFEMEEMTIQLNKLAGDTKNRVVVVKVIISLNKTAKDYDTVNKQLTDNVEIVKGRIQDIISQYTIDNIANSKKEIAEKIKEDLQEFFDSTTIYEITINKFNYQ